MAAPFSERAVPVCKRGGNSKVRVVCHGLVEWHTSVRSRRCSRREGSWDGISASWHIFGLRRQIVMVGEIRGIFARRDGGVVCGDRVKFGRQGTGNHKIGRLILKIRCCSPDGQ